MKKLFIALLITVMSLTAFAGFNVKADSSDGYVWWDEWEDAGKKMMYPRGTRTFYQTYPQYPYSGYDVVFGDYVLTSIKGTVIKRSTLSQDFNVIPYDSISAVYINDTENPWNVTFKPGTQYFAVNVDANGRVVSIDNGSVLFDITDAEEFEGAEAGKYYDVWWNDDTDTMEYRETGLKIHKPQVDVQLKYGDLGTSYPWITKGTVEDNKVAGVTFTDGDLLYKDANNKYTNDAGTNNTPVMNEQKGLTIPAGGFTMFINYYDNGLSADGKVYLTKFWELVNGEENLGEVVLQERFFKPEILGVRTGHVKVENGDTLDLTTGASAQNVKKEALALTTQVYKYNTTTQAYDIEVAIADMDYNTTGNRYKVVYSSTDTTLNLTATKSFTIEVVNAFEPVITVSNKIVSMGQSVNLLEGVSALDGYGVDITANVSVFAGNLNVANPQPGNYEVLYLVKNSHGLTTTKNATITVLDTEKPQVIAPTEKLTIVQGTPFDLLSVVHGTDNYGSVTETVVKDDWFDSWILGEYEIEVHVADQAGNKTKVNYTIEVVMAGTDAQTRIDQLKIELEKANRKITNLEDYISSELDNAKNRENNNNSDIENNLEGQIQDLQATLDNKSQQSMIFTIVVAVVAVAGLGLAFVPKKR